MHAHKYRHITVNTNRRSFEFPRHGAFEFRALHRMTGAEIQNERKGVSYVAGHYVSGGTPYPSWIQRVAEEDTPAGTHLVQKEDG